ncbi:MAG: DUF4097 family beta strand repeat-containing protein [bacterium]|nr:DUF4097 family beta strand repeat-containing protein [bacterium]
MEEAIKKVLDLLEQGKISPEQAERLIRAIREAQSQKEQSEKEKMRTIEKSMGLNIISDVLNEVFTTVGETVKTSINSAFEFGLHGPQEFKSEIFENIKELRVKVLGGDLEIKPSEEEKIIAFFKGQYNIAEEVLNITLIKDGELKVPQNTKLNLYILGGDVKIKGFYQEIQIDMKGGDVEGNVDFNKLTCKIAGGDIEIKTRKSPLKLQLKAIGGDIELPPEMQKSGDSYVFGDENHREVFIKTVGGDFTLKFEEEQ